MTRRWLTFGLFLLMGSGLGWLISPATLAWPGLAVGMAVGAFVWLAIDSFYIARLLRWLKTEQSNELATGLASAAPDLPGVWDEVVGRMRRLLKNRDQQYDESQARLDEFLAAMQASPSGVVLLDAQGRIEWCNQIATQHFGFDPERDLQQHIANLVRDPAFNAYMAAANFTDDVVIPGIFNTRGRAVKLSVHLYPYGKNRKLLLSRDITAVELAEAMRRDFVANVSHEIRTPLTVLSGFIETLQNLPLNETDRTRYLALMAQQSMRMQTLVSDLLTLSRLEGSPAPGNDDWTSTAILLAHCEQDAHALSSIVTKKGHQLTFEAGPLCEIAGVQTELYSAMSNLVANAVRYTPETGRVRVSWTRLADGRGQFQVKDSGPGIAPEHLPRLTERFYRIDRSRSRETGGTGLGLAIVKHVSQRHGAELKIESQPGQGSCFSILFPASRVRAVMQMQAVQTA